MLGLNRGLLLAVATGAVILPPGSGRVASVGGRAGHYTRSQVERYLTPEEVEYVRPGFHITVNSITIPSDNKPVVDLSFTDDKGQPLDRLGNVTPGPLSLSFILAWWDPASRNYTDYLTKIETAAAPSTTPGATATQATSESNGTWTDLAVGHSTYKFKNALPAGFDGTKTHTLGIYATRNLTDILGKNYYANVEQDFRPDGQTVTDQWGEIDQSVSCNRCHDPLSAHGGSRQDVKLCVLCHNPQTTDADTGNTVDFKVMIHKIHDGENLPSVQAGTPYQIIGYQQSVNDFSTVALPQDIRNCSTCHAQSAAAPQSNTWYTYPQRAACGSCHDNINWVTGANHPGGPQADDSACASCHVPQGSQEFDASIMGAHTVPLKSKQLKGLVAQIVSVTNTQPGQNPTVTFKMTNGDGSIVDPSTLGSNLKLVMGGSTTDYSLFPPISEVASGASFNGTLATYTFQNAIPQTATGTWAVAIEARRTITLNPAPPDGPTVTEGADNPIFYIPVTDAAPQPRRQVVDINKCNVCHDRLSLHGGQRFETQYCVMCHNPNGNDGAFRPADQLPTESIMFGRMIHRIHTGENLTNDFTIYGYHGSVNTFNDVRFPGDRRDCLKCHVAGSYDTLPLPDTNLPVATPRDYYTPMQPTAAVCLGCHDTKEAAAHAYQMTAPFGEACAACHASDDEFSVDQVHAR